MNSDKDKELTLEEQVERIRRKRMRSADFSQARMVLNVLFLALAAVGLVLYFWDDAHHVPALMTIGAGMALKVVEFILRFI